MSLRDEIKFLLLRRSERFKKEYDELCRDILRQVNAEGRGFTEEEMDIIVFGSVESANEWQDQWAQRH